MVLNTQASRCLLRRGGAAPCYVPASEQPQEPVHPKCFRGGLGGRCRLCLEMTQAMAPGRRASQPCCRPPQPPHSLPLPVLVVGAGPALRHQWRRRPAGPLPLHLLQVQVLHRPVAAAPDGGRCAAAPSLPPACVLAAPSAGAPRRRPRSGPPPSTATAAHLQPSLRGQMPHACCPPTFCPRTCPASPPRTQWAACSRAGSRRCPTTSSATTVLSTCGWVGGLGGVGWWVGG